MNKKKYYLNKQEALDHFEPSSILGKKNYVKIWGNENGHCNHSHERVKFDISFKLITEYGFEVWTEAVLKSKENVSGRVDILCIDKNGNGVIIEVLDSETDTKFNAKLEKYPLSVYKVPVAGFDLDSWEY